VTSHWVLDAIVHRPDLPLYPGSGTVVGLGLWNNLAATVTVEGVVALAGVWLYLRATQATDRAGSIGFWVLMAFLAITYVANLFSPPPPSVNAVAITALALWLLVPWAAWVDRHRGLRTG
jgi:hypothetical protein